MYFSFLAKVFKPKKLRHILTINLVPGLKIHSRVFALVGSDQGPADRGMSPRYEPNQGKTWRCGSYSNPTKTFKPKYPVVSSEIAFLDTEVRSLPWPSLLLYRQPRLLVATQHCFVALWLHPLSRFDWRSRS